MTDPVAEAAAKIAADASPSSTEPSLIDEIKEGMHELAEKVEHLIHPDAPVPNEPAAGAEQASSGSETSAPTASETGAEVPNVAPAAAEQPVTPPSAPPVSTPAGIVGTVASSADEPAPPTSGVRAVILTHTAAIRHHLSIRGFEQSAVADIHAELDAIEKWL